MFACTSAHQNKASLFIRPQNHIHVASVGSGKNILNILCPQILNLSEQKVAGLKKTLLEAKNKMEDTSGERDPSLRTDRQTLDVACTEQQYHGLQFMILSKANDVISYVRSVDPGGRRNRPGRPHEIMSKVFFLECCDMNQNRSSQSFCSSLTRLLLLAPKKTEKRNLLKLNQC